MKILPVLTAALLLCSCAADRETEALKNSLSEAQTAVRLSAENTKRLEDTYSDIYFHLDSLTVESFKKTRRQRRHRLRLHRPPELRRLQRLRAHVQTLHRQPQPERQNLLRQRPPPAPRQRSMDRVPPTIQTRWHARPREIQ